MDITPIQEQIRAEGLDGWLFFDHHHRDPIAYRVLKLAVPAHVSRRWYYWLPAAGEPCKLVHCIEPFFLDSLPGKKRQYSTWQQQHAGLQEMLKGVRTAAMQYSPNCAIPYVSLVDAGTVELVRGCGVDVRSSAKLVQHFEALWSDEQRESHFEAGRRVDAVRAAAFAEIGRQIRDQGEAHEFAIATFIRDQFRAQGLFTDTGPIVAVNANASNPHYEPTPETSAPIRPGDLVLIDMWAKLDQPRSIYYDITWMGYCGETPPDEMQRVFEIVRDARDKALEFVQSAFAAQREIAGWQVDDVTRNHIGEHGLGDYFVHRTGHSIGEEVHGNGANIDNFETQDDRPIVPGCGFSIEPGIYLPEFGVRSECNCYFGSDQAGATGELQREIVRIG